MGYANGPLASLLLPTPHPPVTVGAPQVARPKSVESRPKALAARITSWRARFIPPGAGQSDEVSNVLKL